jgi:hypothetical protein
MRKRLQQSVIVSNPRSRLQSWSDSVRDRYWRHSVEVGPVVCARGLSSGCDSERIQCVRLEDCYTANTLTLILQ